MPAHPLSRHTIKNFAQTVASWQTVHGRHQLPWQADREPYRIWVSEIMLQQTQVKTVLDYYPRFLTRFPAIEELARTPLEDVMPYWAGLGYYARARNLHRTAQIIVQEYQGRFPRTQAQLKTLPGIGPSTAAAIAAFAFGERVSILDGNVKRILARFAGIDGPLQATATERKMWALAQELVHNAPDTLDMTAYTQGLMDLGALLCTRTAPACGQCPLQKDCYAHKHALWEQLPVRRAAKALPTRKKHMLIWQQDAHLLLQVREKKGIWGGLLSLPEFKQKRQLQDFCVSHGACEPELLQPLAPRSHRFTHFILQIKPWLLQSQGGALPAIDEAATYRWIPWPELAQTALPSPIKRLLLTPEGRLTPALQGQDGG